MNKLHALVLSVFGMLFAASASAEVPASVTTAITTAGTDVGVIGAAILGLIVIIASFAWLRRPIK